MGTRRRESGVVLVVVLVFALLLTSTVATFVRRVAVDRMISHNRDAAARAEALARGGVRFATVLILEDKLQGEAGLALDTPGDLWSIVGETEIPIDPVSTLRIRVRDAGERLNLNAVFQLDEQGIAHENAAPMLEALLEKVIEEMPILPAEKLWDVSELAANLIDWVDRDEVRIRGGAEDDVYQRRDPPQRAANRPLLSLDELRVVEGFDARLVEALRPYLTVYPYAGRTGVNLNTAPPHVLSLLFFDDGVDLRLAQEDTVREILRVRQEEEKVICSEVQADETCTPIRQIVTNAIYPPPTFESDVFVARVEANVSGVRRTIEAVIDRKVGSAPLLLSWRVCRGPAGVPILKNVLGLDLGSHSVKAVELQQGLRSLQAVNVRSVARDELPLSDLVQRFVQIHKLSTDHVITAVRGDRLSVRRLTFPFSERRKLAQAVPFEIEDALPFDLEDVVLDWDTITAERHRGEVIAAIAPRAAVSELIQCLHLADCDPRTVEAEGLALANLRGLFELPGNRLLVDLGHGKTTFCALSADGPVAARSLRVAGEAITEAIAQDRALSLEQAEREKLEHGLFDPVLGRMLPKASAVIDQIAGEMVRFAASIEGVLPGGITDATLVGGSAQLDRIEELLSERTGFSVERLGLPREEEGTGLVAGGSPVVFAPAIALALRGTARAVTDMNFRQDEFARRLDFARYRRDLAPTAVLAAIVLVLAIVSFTAGSLLESRDAGDVEAQVAALYQQALPGQPVPDNPVRSLREALRDAQARAEFLGVYGGNLSALDLLQEISTRIPPDLPVVFEELSIDGQTIRIRVTADSFEAADRLGSELASFAPFAQTRIGAIETDRLTGAKKFNVTISLVAEEAA